MQSENLKSEWDLCPCAQELLDALQEEDNDPLASFEIIANLSNHYGGLAAMYAGSIAKNNGFLDKEGRDFNYFYKLAMETVLGRKVYLGP